MGQIFTVVKEDEITIIEGFGKFDKLCRRGLHWMIPLYHQKAGTLSTRVMNNYSSVESKTKDNVFVTLTLAVQYRIVADTDDKIYRAFYTLSDPKAQIDSYVEDTVRGLMPEYELDTIYMQKEHVASIVLDRLEGDMLGFGYRILDVLINDINPSKVVKKQMNQIYATRCLRAAKAEQAEGLKTKQILAAQADAEVSYQRGLGLAMNRKAILSGTRNALDSMAKYNLAKDTNTLMLINQYFDAMKSMVTRGSRVIFTAQTKKKTTSSFSGFY